MNCAVKVCQMQPSAFVLLYIFVYSTAFFLKGVFLKISDGASVLHVWFQSKLQLQIEHNVRQILEHYVK